jgi:hypothetical protein
MDIDDLLAEVAVDSTPRETRDLQELARCWVAERVAPELLPWPSDLMDRVLDRIRRQVRDDQTGDMNPKTNFKLIIIQTELERFKFLVRSFLRARLKKVRRICCVVSSEVLIALLDRPTPPPHPSPTYRLPRHPTTPPLAVRIPVPHIPPIPPRSALLVVVSRAVPGVLAAAGRYDGWNQHGGQAG